MNTLSRSANRRAFLKHAALAGAAAPFAVPGARGAEASPATAATPLRVAVITSGHTYDVPNFHRLFRALPGIEADILHLDDLASSPETDRDGYGAVLFYIMLMDGPTDEKLPWYSGKPKTALEHLGATEQGIVVLHHALLAYPRWPFWSELVGIADRKFGFYHDQQIEVKVANSQHPITRGLQSWAMLDETYTMADAGADSEILLTLDHPKSMKTIGWARQFRKSRVFCLESGHDNSAWSNPNFREVLRRGLEWCARRR